ncbi:hypothetical protein C8J56DRAFT_169515 [Mycena floridula]|nr:hypothetical protein C8J56DRAFT_169515 [Mycena floridula]
MIPQLHKLFTSTPSSSKDSSLSKTSCRADLPVFQTKDLNYIYASPQASTSSFASSSLQSQPLIQQQSPRQTRSTPSPLTFDLVRSPKSTPAERPGKFRSVSYDHHVHYPVLRPESPRSFSTSSSQSHSSSCTPPTVSILKGASANSSPTMPSRRPALKQSQTWPGPKKQPSKPHVSFLNPNRTETLNMHPLLAYSREHPAPIAYNVAYPPSPDTLLDRSTRSSLPAHMLLQPATDPFTYSKLVLKSDKLPWTIIVTNQSVLHSKKMAAVPVTNFDVFQATYHTLSARITQEEWARLGHGSRAQRKATRAYEKRCLKTGGGWDDGVRRVDFLGEKSLLIGVQVDKESGAEEGRVARLIFTDA